MEHKSDINEKNTDDGFFLKCHPELRRIEMIRMPKSSVVLGLGKPSTLFPGNHPTSLPQVNHSVSITSSKEQVLSQKQMNR